MLYCKLIHPELGVCAEMKAINNSVKEIENLWRYKYGKNFYRCEFVVLGTRELSQKRRVVNCITGEIYPTISKAALAMGLHRDTVLKHCTKKTHCFGRPGVFLAKYE